MPPGLLMLAACGGGNDDKADSAPAETAGVPAVPDTAPVPPADDKEAMARWEEDRGYEPDPAEPPLKDIEPGIGTGDKAIPAAIQGRWALDPADCAKKPGSDLTALVIDAANLRFHESHGELARVRERDASRIVADYKFSGEGMDWNRLMVLDTQNRGQVLIRRDYGEGAAPAAMRYTRCAT